MSPTTNCPTASGQAARRRAASLAGTAAAMAGALVVLHASGHGALSPPPLGVPGRWGAWLDQREPVAAAFALLRLVALACVWYLATVTALGVALRAVRAGRLVAVSDRFTVPPVRRLLAGTVTAGLVGLGPLGGVAGAQPAPSPPTTSSNTTNSVVVAGRGPDATVVLRRLPADSQPPTTAATPPTAGTPATAAIRPTPAVPTVPDTEKPARWTVQSGDCFWTIAEEVLQRSWGRAPTDGEIVPYWRSLIDANRQALADKGNADLIFPGQVFDVPPVPPAPLARTG